MSEKFQKMTTWVREKLNKVRPALIVLALLIICFIIVWVVPWMMAENLPESVSAFYRFKAEDVARRTNAQFIGGLLAFFALYLGWRRIKVTEDGQITERFTRAVDQLGATHTDSGKPVVEIRIGGIFALERIAKDSKEDHWTIMEILTAYVRENAPIVETFESVKSGFDIPDPGKDVQAAITVIERRKWWKEETKEQVIDLSKTDLSKTILPFARLKGAYISLARLNWVNLRGACLEKATLLGTCFDAAYLVGVHLEGANLNLAEGLTIGQVSDAIIDEKTILPDYLLDLDESDVPENIRETWKKIKAKREK